MDLYKVLKIKKATTNKKTKKDYKNALTKFDDEILGDDVRYRVLPKKDFYKRAKEMIKREYNSLDSKIQDFIYLSEEDDEYNLVGNAIRNYADLDEDEEVFYCFDNTVFKSCKIFFKSSIYISVNASDLQ